MSSIVAAAEQQQQQRRKLLWQRHSPTLAASARLSATLVAATVGVARPATDQSPGDIAAEHLSAAHYSRHRWRDVFDQTRRFMQCSLALA